MEPTTTNQLKTEGQPLPNGNPLSIPQVDPQPAQVDGAIPAQDIAIGGGTISMPPLQQRVATVAQTETNVVMTAPLSAATPTAQTPNQTKPVKSNTLGITIGIVFLIAVVVGASLYYYFFILTKKPAEIVTPPPKTLIQKNDATTTLQVPEVVTPIATPIDDTASLQAEIEGANQDPGLSDSLMNNFSDLAK